METDKHYFFEGLFIIGFSIAAAIFAVWLGLAWAMKALVIWRRADPQKVPAEVVERPETEDAEVRE